jgi:phosphate transport system regulatory protein PhoU
VLVYDKRGPAEGYSQVQASFADLAEDVVAGVRLLRDHPEVDPDRVGVHGHSEGGWTVLEAADLDAEVAFEIASAASALPPDRTQVWMNATQLGHAGVSERLREPLGATLTRQVVAPGRVARRAAQLLGHLEGSVGRAHRRVEAVPRGGHRPARRVVGDLRVHVQVEVLGRVPVPEGVALRHHFTEELDQLRLQVELMGVKVDQNLERMRAVLVDGDPHAAASAVAGDDEIDAMVVSLTERCYDILARESPVASDLRFIVSVLRILSELERIGDLSLRVVNLLPHRQLWGSSAPTFDVLVSMGETAVAVFRDALRAWSAQDLGLATELAGGVVSMETHYEVLMRELLRLEGPDAVAVATNTLIAGRSLERIADHAAIIGARLRYLLTGDPNHLTAEVR